MSATIMIQGTMSNSGKSFVTAGLCRIFKQDGYKVAPFKSQNMALNSYITEDGFEIGRAQAVQAEAAGIRPSKEMNPILIKPTSTTGSQIIISGEVYGNMNAMDYYKNKTRFVPDIKNAFNTLSSEYDIIVIEGAGSPAEINLRENDIVNMGLAKMVGAPVLLVADIDRGGVFASLYGTVKLLEPDEQKYIKGYIINKFRGDPAILKPGLDMIEEKISIPHIGIIPMENIDIDDEDSMSERLTRKGINGSVDIAVIRLPHISNFTDFSAFERIPGVSLRYVSDKDELKEPDLIILPGTKNTMGDMKWLRETGMETVILRAAQKNIYIIGICGGYQMLGRRITDPHGVEYGGNMRGMGLLDTETVFETEKTRKQISGKIVSDIDLFSKYKNTDVSGYEIHMGKTVSSGKTVPLIELSDGRCDVCNESKTVIGTYLHGLFDTDGLAFSIVQMLADKKGVQLETSDFNLNKYKEKQYDKLAALMRKSLDMDAIYEILKKGI